MEGVQICYSQVYEEIHAQPSMLKTSIGTCQLADPTSLKRGEDYPDEWAKRQAKLARQAKEAVRKFNEDSAAAASTVVDVSLVSSNSR